MNFKDLLYYDEASPSGLRWRVKRNNHTLKDDVAGSLDKTTGYYRVSVNNKLHYCHRVVYILHNGGIEDRDVIDHVDGNKINNNIDNLRVVTQQINTRNRKGGGAKRSCVAGVRFDKYAIKPAWVASWKDVDGNRKSKRFIVKEHGDENAYIMALEYRIKMIKILNEQGAGYTERHGKFE